MTVNELIAKFNQLGLSGDEHVRIAAFGGIGRHGKDIRDVSIGFDWDKGSVLVHPLNALQLMPLPKRKPVKPT